MDRFAKVRHETYALIHDMRNKAGTRSEFIERYRKIVHKTVDIKDEFLDPRFDPHLTAEVNEFVGKFLQTLLQDGGIF